MEDHTTQVSFFELIQAPAFLAENGIIRKVNQSAKGLCLFPGMEVKKFVDLEELGAILPTSGSLLTQIKVGERLVPLSIQPHKNGHLFLLENQDEYEGLRAMSLAALSLRSSLSELSRCTDVLADSAVAVCEGLKQYVFDTQRALFQVIRIALNMADAYWLVQESVPDKEPTEIGEFLEEIVEKVNTLAENQDFQIHLHKCPYLVLSIDRQFMERAILNLISNAMRYTPENNGRMEIGITQTPKHCVVRIQDNGSGLDQEVRDSLFSRYRREVALEPHDRGIGLGLLIVQSIVASHGGALYIGSTPSGGTEVALSISKEMPEKGTMAQPNTYVDYAGEWDHTLLELSRELDSVAFAYL